jgi:penicillin-binding protein 1A
MQRAATLAVQQGLRRLDRKARGFVRPEATVLVDGRFPAVVKLDEWDRPLQPDTIVHGVVLNSDRSLAVIQLGDYRAALTARDIAWTRRTVVSEALPKGAIVPVLVQSLKEEGDRKIAVVQLEQDPKLEGALVAVEPRTGAVKAMVGGYDFDRSKFNRATQAFRQVGSAFKPIIYAAAIEKAGYTPSTIIVDAPISFPDNNTVWSPHNYDGTFWGPIPVRRAIEMSRNIPAIKTLQTIGIKTGIEYAQKMGLTGQLQPYLPLAIGAGEATPIEMASAFATFANQGLRMKPMYVTRIADRAGNVVEEARPVAHDAIRADTAFIMTSLLRGVAERGTAAKARVFKRPIAGKTGTTSDWTDTWFVGYEPMLSAAVWLGFDDKALSLGKGQDGARTALPIWMEFWQTAIKDKPIEELPVPANILFVPVDPGGRPAPPGTPGVRMEAFIAGTEPRASFASTPAAAPATP